MDHFEYRNGALFAEDVPVADIAQAVGTPFYCYSTATIRRHYQVFAEAFADLDATICFAVKANSNLAVLSTLAAMGAGADVVSGGELQRALSAGIPPKKIVFSGVGKTRDELALALNADIYQINVESEPELEALSEVADALGKTAPVSLRINPDVDAKTHAKISTGKGENKFGIDWARAKIVYARAASLKGIDLKGVAVHIGSQLTDLAPFREAFKRVRDMVLTLRADGLPVSRIDFGGGLGVPYKDHDDDVPPLPADYARIVHEAAEGLDCSLVFEPGRLIVANAGILVSSVIYQKHGTHRRFIVVDAAMNDLMRPTLYDAYHGIIPVNQPKSGAPHSPADVVGPICETGDTFATERDLPEVEPGDLVAIRSAGAYGAVMASSYNSRALVPEVLVNKDAFSVVRERVDINAQLSHERLPEWLTQSADGSKRTA